MRIESSLVQFNPPEFDVQADCIETCDPVKAADTFATEVVDDHIETWGPGPTGAINVETIVACPGALGASRCAMRATCKISSLDVEPATGGYKPVQVASVDHKLL